MITTCTRRLAAAFLAASVGLAACGGDDESTDTTAASATVESAGTTGVTEPVAEPAGSTTTAAPGVTTGAPNGSAATSPTEPNEPTESIDELIAVSQDESPLVVYGNPNDQMWESMKAGFGELYPWIEVQTFDLGGVEAFQRYLSESATGVGSADLIIASEAAGWLDLVDRGGVVPYADPQVAALPDFARLAPGVYTMSVDPLIAVYNEHLVPADEQASTLAELAALAPDLPTKLATIEVENSQAYMANYGFVTKGGDDAWSVLEALAPFSTAEASTGPFLGKALSGEYSGGFFVAGTLRALIDTDPAVGGVLDYQYLTDATPLVPRGMGVTASGDSPASAKLFVNFMLSAAGAEAACESGLSPYHPDSDCAYGYQAIEAAVGAGNTILVPYDSDLEAQRDAITSRWNETFGR